MDENIEKLELILKCKKYIIDVINSDNKSFYLLYSEIKLFVHTNPFIDAFISYSVEKYKDLFYDKYYQKYLNALKLSIKCLKKYSDKDVIYNSYIEQSIYDFPFKFLIFPDITLISHSAAISHLFEPLHNKKTKDFLWYNGLFFYYYLFFLILQENLSKEEQKKYFRIFTFLRRNNYYNETNENHDWISEDIYIFENYSGFNDLCIYKHLLYQLKIVVISSLHKIINFLNNYEVYAQDDITKDAINMTQKEKDVITLIKQNFQEKEIATKLKISLSAVKDRKKKVRIKIEQLYPQHTGKRLNELIHLCNL